MFAPKFARAFGLLAAASAIAALSACGGDVVVNGGAGGGGLPAEDRLSADGGGGSAARAAAAWGILGDGVGTGADRRTLVTAAERAALSPSQMAKAAGMRPRDGGSGMRYRCADGACGTFARRDSSGLWREESLRNWDHAFLYADAGVTQSGRGSYVNEDIIAVALGDGDNGNVTYKVGYTSAPWDRPVAERWTFDSEADSAAIQLGSATETVTLARSSGSWSAGGERGAIFRASTSAGDMWLAVTTDIADAGDTDWLATGLWARTPAAGSTAEHRFGVFANGGDPFDDYDFFDPSPMVGSATYTGDASGVYSRVVSGTRTNDFFEADATLAADFGSAAVRDAYGAGAYGALSGTVDNFTVGGEDLAGDPALTLRGAPVGPFSPIGYRIAGGTQMTFDNSHWQGAWGAGFFGNPADDATGADALPLAVAGTFGATAGSGAQSRTIIGAFGARR